MTMQVQNKTEQNRNQGDYGPPGGLGRLSENQQQSWMCDRVWS